MSWEQKWKQKQQEARRDLGRKTYEKVWEDLEYFAQKDNTYLHFSDVKGKLGLNPRSRFNTPIGVYAYPLKEMWEKMYSRDIPFGQDRPFLYVFETTPEAKILDVSQEIPDKVWYKILESFISRFEFSKDRKNKKKIDYLKFLQDKILKEKITRNNMTMWIENIDADMRKESYILSKILRDNLEDTYDFRIRAQNKPFIESEPEVAQEMLQALESMKEELKSDAKSANIEELAQILDFEAEEGTTFKEHGNMGKFWWLGYTLRNPVKWSSWMYKDLGIDGITDKTGIGMIHGAEPQQAVFFNPKIWKLVLEADNPWAGRRKEPSSKRVFDWVQTLYEEYDNFYEILRNNSSTYFADRFSLLEPESQKAWIQVLADEMTDGPDNFIFLDGGWFYFFISHHSLGKTLDELLSKNIYAGKHDFLYKDMLGGKYFANALKSLPKTTAALESLRDEIKKKGESNLEKYPILSKVLNYLNLLLDSPSVEEI